MPQSFARLAFARLAAIVLLLVSCGAADPDKPPIALPASQSPAGTGAIFPETEPGAAASRATVSPLPPRPPLYPLPAPVVPEGPIGAAPNPGPVTGYGPGGMGRIPGAPANPPYH
jgi:hypothetical protein